MGPLPQQPAVSREVAPCVASFCHPTRGPARPRHVIRRHHTSRRSGNPLHPCARVYNTTPQGTEKRKMRSRGRGSLDDQAGPYLLKAHSTVMTFSISSLPFSDSMAFCIDHEQPVSERAPLPHRLWRIPPEIRVRASVGTCPQVQQNSRDKSSAAKREQTSADASRWQLSRDLSLRLFLVLDKRIALHEAGAAIEGQLHLLDVPILGELVIYVCVSAPRQPT